MKNRLGIFLGLVALVLLGMFFLVRDGSIEQLRRDDGLQVKSGATNRATKGDSANTTRGEEGGDHEGLAKGDTNPKVKNTEPAVSRVIPPYASGVVRTVSDVPKKDQQPFTIKANQSVAEILQSADLSDPKVRAAVVAAMTERENARYQAVLAKAQQLGIPVRIKGPGHRVQILHDFRGNEPLYRSTLNTNAAISTGANLLNQAPYGLNGQGMTVGVWDAARARTNHVELAGKVTVGDSTTANDDHSTHVAGTIAAKGVDPKAKGMGISTLIRTYDWNTDYAEMTAIGAATATQGATKIPLSNHSYGYNASAADMGRYETECNTLDALALSLPYYLVFWAAGNEQDTLNTVGNGYQSITFNGLAKNILTVGAADDAVTSGVRDVSKGTLAYFSSMGPCDDGRIKPDVVANGVNVYSCIASNNTSYDGTYSGTSMATPNACGSAALLEQLYKSNFSGQIMRASMLKALLIHTADDVGRPGPDYQYGWGYMNAKAAADVILAHKASLAQPKMIEDSITAATMTRTTSFVWDGSSPIRATVVWTDPAGVAQTATNSRTRNLVNDLDLKITAPNGTTTYLPYVMPFVGVWTTNSMTNNAVTGTNKVDNVERVDIPAPTQAGTYTVTVGMYSPNSLSGTSQTYSLIVTGGQNLEANPPPVVNITAPANGSTVLPGSPISITATATDLAVGGQPGQVTKVEFFDGDTLLGEDTVAPYQFSWVNAASGAHVITAKATDNENTTAISSSVNVTVLVGSGEPTITSFSPTSGVAGDSVVLTGNNLGGATSVRFGAITAPFSADSLTQVTATVPSSAITAPITVSNSYGSATTSSNFTIIPIVFREDFASLTTGNNTTTAGSSATWTGNTNFPTGVNDYQAGGAVKLGTGSLAGSITSRAINLAGNGGAFTVSLKVKGWSTREGDIKVTAGVQTQTVAYTATMSGDFETKTLSFTGGTSATTIKIETTAKRAFIDDVAVYAEAPSSPPVITSPSTAGGIMGQAFSYQITASNAPTSYGATNLPAWASINTTNGLISGPNPIAGTNVVTISASNSFGVGSNNLTITILPSGGGGGSSFSGVLAGWDTTGLSTSNTWAPVTNNATTVNTNMTMTTQLTRGSSITASGTGVSNAIGGSGGWSTIPSDNTSWVFAFQANAGYSVSVTNITGFTRKSGSGPSNVIVAVSLNGGAYTNAGSFSTTITSGTGSSFGLVLTNISSLQNVSAGQIIKFRINPSGTSGNWYMLNGSSALQVNGTMSSTVISPSISADGSLSAVNTIYGTASTNPTSFTISGTNLVAGVTVAPPSGFQLSATNTNNFASAGSSITVGSSGSVSNATVYVRLGADTAVGTYSGNIVCSSPGASNVDVATAASTVSRKPISVTADSMRKTYGALDPELTYTPSEVAPFSGGLVREAGEAAGSYRIRQGSLTAGSNYEISFTEGDFAIVKKRLSVIANDRTKTFGQTLTLGAGQTGFTTSEMVGTDKIDTVTITASGGTEANDPAGPYVLTPSAPVGQSFTTGNYDIYYTPGTLTVVNSITGITLSDWANRYPNLTDPSPTADPDGDGMSNLMEFYLGLDPTQPGGNGGSSMTVSNGPSNTVSMTYWRAKGITGVSAAVQASGDLSSSNNWGTDGVMETVKDAADPNYEEVTATVTNPPGATKMFMRLKVSQP